ncbi:MAG: type II toxin-antitoxin system RelE/ParE family toxin [Clostridiales Family XIII bacterium]|jgi:hypothetical protein|nr:type II toxin-antitoxin system RelE/ParE family toxin [Clostridiales Family XIII bacterium]
MNKRQYVVKILPTYEADLLETIAYIRDVLKNKTAAEKLLNETERKIYERAYMPTNFEPYRSKKKREYVYYIIRVGNYMIFYVVIGNIMEVRRLIYRARDRENLL